MLALMKRLDRGIAAIKQGDRDTAENLLNEVSAEPGSDEPIAGLLEEAEARFYELRARLSGEEFLDADAAEVADDAADDLLDPLPDEGVTDAAAADQDDEPDDADSWNTDMVLLTRDPESDRRLSVSMEYYNEDASVELEQHEESYRQLEFGAEQTRDTLITVKSYNSSITLSPDAQLPEAVVQHLGHDLDADREWTELHVEEVRVLKTTLVYPDEPQRPALPCACQE